MLPMLRSNQLFKEFDRLFDLENVAERSLPVDFIETDKDYQYQVDLPGMTQENIKINVEGRSLTIQGERDFQRSERGNYERWSGKFYRKISLPRAADTEKINASLKDGILTIKINKAELAQPRQIEIS